MGFDFVNSLTICDFVWIKNPFWQAYVWDHCHGVCHDDYNDDCRDDDERCSGTEPRDKTPHQTFSLIVLFQFINEQGGM